MEQESRPAKISITGKVSFEDDITLSQAAQIIAFIDSSSAAGTVIPLRPASTRLVSPTPITSISNPREALESSGAKTNPEKIVAFALYVGKEGAKDTFTIEDIKPLFRRARESTPRNLSRDLDAAIRSNWVAEADTKGEFYVTDTATSVLDTGFDSLRSGRSNGRKRRSANTRRPKRTTLTVPEELSNVDVVPQTSAEFGNFHRLSTRTDKFLWAINIAKEELGLEAISNQGVVWLTDKLGEGIPATDIAAYFRQNHKAGYVNRSMQDNRIRITPLGQDHLREKATRIENAS